MKTVFGIILMGAFAIHLPSVCCGVENEKRGCWPFFKRSKVNVHPVNVLSEEDSIQNAIILYIDNLHEQPTALHMNDFVSFLNTSAGNHLDIVTQTVKGLTLDRKQTFIRWAPIGVSKSIALRDDEYFDMFKGAYKNTKHPHGRTTDIIYAVKSHREDSVANTLDEFFRDHHR